MAVRESAKVKNAVTAGREMKVLFKLKKSGGLEKEGER